MLIRAGSTPVTRTTGSAGPQRRGLTLLTFLLSSRWYSSVMNIRINIFGLSQMQV